MSIKIASMNFGDCDTILHNTPNGMKNIAEVLGPNGEVYWSAIKELTGIPPLSIRSNGTMLLDYLISGNMSQTGTPTPTTPIQPQETGERTGNLFDKDNATVYDCYITSNGQWATGAGNKTVRISCDSNTQYTLSTASTYPVFRIMETNSDNIPSDGSPVSGTLIYYGSGNTYTFTTSNTAKYIIFQSNSTSLSQWLSELMLNTGSTALPYEPYGIKIPISSASTTTPVYLGEVESTRRIKKLVLDGTENWTYRSGDPTNVFFMYLPTAKTGEVAMSNAYPYYSGTDFVDMNDKEFSIIRSNLAIRNSDYQYESQFKAYLAQQYANGTPVTVWYVLANPTTGIVNEPLRKIGDYADTVSYEQAGVQIPTLHGNTVIDVETTLKPSQMYIKYK